MDSNSDLAVAGQHDVRRVLDQLDGNGDGIGYHQRAVGQGERTDGGDEDSGDGRVDDGPPAAREYAVEPVGVAIISPSARYSVRNWSSIWVRMRASRARRLY